MALVNPIEPVRSNSPRKASTRSTARSGMQKKNAHVFTLSPEPKSLGF